MFANRFTIDLGVASLVRFASLLVGVVLAGNPLRMALSMKQFHDRINIDQTEFWPISEFSKAEHTVGGGCGKFSSRSLCLSFSNTYPLKGLQHSSLFRALALLPSSAFDL